MKPNAGLQTGRRAYFHGPKTIKALLLAGVAALLLGHLSAAPLTPAILPRVILHPDPNPIQAFGASVAIDGKALVVGSLSDGPFLTGSAYVFTRDGAAWIRAQKLEPPAGSGGYVFGWAVAIRRDTIAIGTYAGDKTYIFGHAAGAWSLQQVLDVSGTTLAIDDDTLLVANPSADVSEKTGSLLPHAGMAWIWTRKDNAWYLAQTLTASDARENAMFGSSGALRRDTLVLGAPGDSSAVDESGSAYAFTRRGQSWNEVQKLRPTDPHLNAAFGTAVALQEDVILVGAPGSEDFPDAGAAYVFRRVGEGWRQDQRLAASDGFAPDHFGRSVGLSGDRLVVGQLGTVFFQPLGAVYVFAQHGVRWKEVARLTLNSNEPDFFGNPVAVSGDDVLVGDDTQNGIGGAAYLFGLQPRSGSRGLTTEED